MDEARQGYDEELPWLAAVDDEDGPSAVSGRKMAAFIAVVLIALALVAGTMFWVGQRDGPGGAPELIAAPEGPYKVRPDDPGGLDVAGDSETAYATSAGVETDARIDQEKLAEAPVIEVREQPQPAPRSTPREEVPTSPERREAIEQPKRADAATPSGVSIQLGAFDSATQAERAWALLSSRFPQLAGFQKHVPQATVNGRNYHRLRAAAPDRAAAQAACNAVKAGGEVCLLVN